MTPSPTEIAPRPPSFSNDHPCARFCKPGANYPVTTSNYSPVPLHLIREILFSQPPVFFGFVIICLSHIKLYSSFSRNFN